MATNTLVVTLPLGVDLSVTRAAFGRFGDIDSIEMISDDEAKIVFFDVRAAVCAVKTLQATPCVYESQKGTRIVRLPGNVQLNVEELSLVSNMERNADDGAYIMEFFDIRDAARFQDRAVTNLEKKSVVELDAPPGLSRKVDSKPVSSPPGLMPPPGLDAPVPPGLVDRRPSSKSKTSNMTAQSQPTVLLGGLPKQMLSKAMLECTLQQAGIAKAVRSLDIKDHAGKPSGEVAVTLASASAAEQCVRHFSSCRWGGSAVTAKIILAESTNLDNQHHGFSAKAPAFVPLPQFASTARFSADAPEFKPAPTSKGLSAQALAFVPCSVASKLGTRSDASTESGDSDDESKRSSPREPVAPLA